MNGDRKKKAHETTIHVFRIHYLVLKIALILFIFSPGVMIELVAL